MRTREMGYEDYGITRGEERQILIWCRNCTPQEQVQILKIAQEVNKEIGSQLFFSIVEGVSYEKITSVNFVPIPKVDFYGYRRKCLAKIDRWRKEL